MAVQIPLKDRFKRFLYTSSDEAKYVSGDAELHHYYDQENLKVLKEMLASDLNRYLNMLEVTNSENFLPRRKTLFVALAYAASNSSSLTDTDKNKIYATLLKLCKSDDDLFMFLKFYTPHRKTFCSGLNKVIREYYNNKEPLALAKDATRCTSYHGWKHKDVFKLSHIKTENLLTEIVIKYILYDLPKAEVTAKGNEMAGDIIKFLTSIQKLKRSEDEAAIIQLVKELHATYTQIPSFYRKSQPIWEVLIPEMPLKELIEVLPRLFKFGFLKGSSSKIENLIVECLTNAQKVKESKIHPAEVFIGLRNFEKGGKPMDPRLAVHLEVKEAARAAGTSKAAEDPPKKETKPKKQPVIPHETPTGGAITTALNKTLQLSYQNLQSTGKRIMISIDMSEKMVTNKCLRSKNLTCLEAAVILTLSILNAEKDVQVTVNNGDKVSFVHLAKEMTVSGAIQRLKKAKSSFVMPSAAMQWASAKKKQFDVFINLMYYHHWFLLVPKELREKERPVEALKRYRKRMGSPHTKLISFSLYSPHLSLADGSENILDICGFDKDVPIAVEAFCRGLFC